MLGQSSLANFRRRAVTLVATLLAVSIAPVVVHAQGEEAFFVGQVNDLDAVKQAPPGVVVSVTDWGSDTSSVWVDGGEAIVFNSALFRRDREVWNRFDGWVVAIRGRKGQKVKGSILLGPEGKSSKPYSFTVTLDDTSDNARKAFWNAWRSQNLRMVNMGRPGGAWFRHQLRRAEAALDRKATSTNRQRRFFGSRATSADDTLALMSGGLAVSENLQLDREIPIRGEEGSEVALSSIRGITVREFDWSELTKDLKPAEDALAAMIPVDQHAIFLPSFSALVALIDTASEHGTPLVQMAAPQSEDARSQARYEKQLCLGLNSAARLIGPQLIKSLAVTGSDAYFRTGTDVAVLMETSSPQALRQLIQTQQAIALAKYVPISKVSGAIDGTEYTGVQTPTREICSFVATIDNTIVVTNSLAQLGRLIETSKDRSQSLAASPEYTFFRDRYPLGDDDESGLMILSDATIRRWCGPKWRIAASRRTRVAAAMSEIQASHLNDLVLGGLEEKKVVSDLGVARGETFVLSGNSINSEMYGDLAFLTPIAELNLTSVSQEEARMYRRWRDGYQRAWSNYFDPIAMRFSIKEDSFGADVTVMPLIARSSYRQLQEISGGKYLKDGVGDPHPEAMLQWMLSLNPDSPQLKMYTNMLGAFAPQIRIDPLSWLGEGMSLYIDKDPLWKEAMKADDPDEFFEDNVHRLPLALHVEVRDALKLTLFMTGLRAFIEQTVPGVSVWEPKKHKDEPYVKITATDRAGIPDPDRFALYYAATGEGLTFTLSESLMHRALERRVARRIARKNAAKAPKQDADKQLVKAEQIPWPNQNVVLRVSREGLAIFEEVFGRGYEEEMRRMSFNNLAVLNEWKRLFPELDPVEVHETFWQRRLLCPSGGDYVWNDTLKTMESSVYGSPHHRKDVDGPSFPPALRAFAGGEFGLEFEENGLRARMEVKRK